MTTRRARRSPSWIATATVTSTAPTSSPRCARPSAAGCAIGSGCPRTSAREGARAEFERVFQAMDADENKKVSIDEWVRYCRALPGGAVAGADADADAGADAGADGGRAAPWRGGLISDDSDDSDYQATGSMLGDSDDDDDDDDDVGALGLLASRAPAAAARRRFWCRTTLIRSTATNLRCTCTTGIAVSCRRNAPRPRASARARERTPQRAARELRPGRGGAGGVANVRAGWRRAGAPARAAFVAHRAGLVVRLSAVAAARRATDAPDAPPTTVEFSLTLPTLDLAPGRRRRGEASSCVRRPRPPSASSPRASRSSPRARRLGRRRRARDRARRGRRDAPR